MEFFGLEKLSLVDFDGKVASTVFMGACNFRCPFCHNSPLVIDFNCLPPISEEEILAFLDKRQGIIEGVCISGGEPTLNKDLPDFCKKVKDKNLAVKLDTNGTNPQMIKLLAKEKLVDYFAMDIKSSKTVYPLITDCKCDMNKISESVDFFINGNVDYEFRTTLIKEYHDIECVKDMAIWLKGGKKLLLQKFKDSENCIRQGLNGIDKATALEFIKTLSPNIPTALRGYE